MHWRSGAVGWLHQKKNTFFLCPYRSVKWILHNAEFELWRCPTKFATRSPKVAFGSWRRDPLTAKKPLEHRYVQMNVLTEGRYSYGNLKKEDGLQGRWRRQICDQMLRDDSSKNDIQRANAYRPTEKR
jgi:hypothetical protein